MTYEKPKITCLESGIVAIQGEKSPLGNPEPPRHTISAYEADE
jgi:hypothetical protein